MSIIGYARERYTGQSLHEQVEKLNRNSCNHIFQDSERNSHANRVEFGSCISSLKTGDVLLATRIDRLVDSIFDFLHLVNFLKSRDIGLIILEQNIDTRTEKGKQLFDLVTSLVQFEIDLRAEWQAEGIARAKLTGQKFGRPGKLTDTMKNDIYLMRMAGATIEQLVIEFGVSKASIYRSLQAVRA